MGNYPKAHNSPRHSSQVARFPRARGPKQAPHHTVTTGATVANRPEGTEYLPTRPSSRLVKHSDPAHADPYERDDGPAARSRATGRKHRFIGSGKAPHNLYIATPINARNKRPEEFDSRRGVTLLLQNCGLRRQGMERRNSARRAPKGVVVCTVHRDSPNPYTLRQLLLLFFLRTLVQLFLALGFKCAQCTFHLKT
jgi:hypothetical protein